MEATGHEEGLPERTCTGSGSAEVIVGLRNEAEAEYSGSCLQYHLLWR
jgi:hypothetical protein